MKIDLFASSAECGCAAKVPAGQLKDTLAQCELPTSDRVIVGPDTLDDAGVYELDNGQLLVQTVDFFPPVARTPFEYGQIAAANALSDIYAMGAEPLTALAVVCFPTKQFPPEVLTEISAGAIDKLKEAGCVLLGGHSVVDPAAKYGLAVTGIVERDRLMDNAHSRPGDALILTKPLGTGVTLMAIKAQMASAAQEREVYRVMAALNKPAARIAADCGATCCTDITGFGLLGHSLQLARASDVQLELAFDALPRLEGILEWAGIGLMSANTYANRDYVGDDVAFAVELEQAERDILFDPQTSGGLLVSCPAETAETFVERARDEISTPAAIVGRVQPASGSVRIQVRRSL